MRTVPWVPITVMLLSKLLCGEDVLKVNVPHPPCSNLKRTTPPSSNSVDVEWVWLTKWASSTSMGPNTHIRMSKKWEN